MLHLLTSVTKQLPLNMEKPGHVSAIRKIMSIQEKSSWNLLANGYLTGRKGKHLASEISLDSDILWKPTVAVFNHGSQLLQTNWVSPVASLYRINR